MNADVKVIAIAMVAVMSVATVILVTYEKPAEQGFNLENTMDSVLETTSSADGLPTVYGTGFVIEYGGLYVLTNAHLVVSGTGLSTS